MGLFEKKFCCICGQKAGMLTRQKLAAGEYLCGDCRSKCSPFMTWREFESMSADDIRAHMEYMAQSEETFSTQFHETWCVRTGIMGGTRVVSVDENNGWWVPVKSGLHDVLSFDQVMDVRLVLDTRHLSPDEMHKPDRPRMPMPPMGMPGCAPDEEITHMKVMVRVDHPWLHEVELDVMNAVFVTEGDIRAGYDCAQQLLSYFGQQAQAARMRAQAQATAQAVSAAQKTAAPATDAFETLKKFKELLDMGAITQAEYDAKKKQLLNL